jgi:DNA-binding GntR family transcriptional regulator
VPEQPLDGTLKNRIYANLRRSIIMGHRPPGEKINVRKIAEQYDASITPVREALQMLHQEGLVTIKPHSGYLVTRLTLKQLRDLFELREILELGAAERAAKRISDEQIAEMERTYAGYTGGDDESYARYTAENRRFHCLIAEATGNQELTEVLGHVHDRLARFMVMRRAGCGMQQSHARIIEALRERDPEAACAALSDELADTRSVVLDRVIQEQGASWHVAGRKDERADAQSAQ